MTPFATSGLPRTKLFFSLRSVCNGERFRKHSEYLFALSHIRPISGADQFSKPGYPPAQRALVGHMLENMAYTPINPRGISMPTVVA